MGVILALDTENKEPDISSLNSQWNNLTLYSNNTANYKYIKFNVCKLSMRTLSKHISFLLLYFFF